MRGIPYEMLDMAEPNGHVLGFSIHGEQVLRRCLVCDATFPQTDDGFQQFKEHEFYVHERPVLFSWSEINGLQLTIAVVEREEPEEYRNGTRHQIEILGRAEDGTIYYLGEVKSVYSSFGDQGWKWKPKHPSRMALPNNSLNTTPENQT